MGKVISLIETCEVIAKARKAGWKIVLTNGCFDVLHRGHFETLRFAKGQGQILIVAVNTDEAVRTLKGPHRPINKGADRMAMVAAIAGVDYVFPFGTAEDPSVEPVIESLSPDVLVKGGDYAPDGVVGAAIVERAGGRVVIAPKVPDISTTETINAIKGSCEVAPGQDGEALAQQVLDGARRFHEAAGFWPSKATMLKGGFIKLSEPPNHGLIVEPKLDPDGLKHACEEILAAAPSTRPLPSFVVCAPPPPQVVLRIGTLELPLKLVNQEGILRGEDLDLPVVIPERIEIFLTEDDRRKIREAMKPGT